MTTKTNPVKRVTCECGHTIHRNHIYQVPNGQQIDTWAYCPVCGAGFVANSTHKNAVGAQWIAPTASEKGTS